MSKIGLLSDTHNHLDHGMINFLSTCDEIWHAGDIGNLEIIDQLKAIAPVRAVYGNIDNHQLRTELSSHLAFTYQNVNVFITHIGGYPKKYAPGIKSKLQEHKTKLFIAAHSHILKVIFDKELDCLHINPGAAGIQGFHTVRTMVRFNISKGNISDLEIWEKARK